MECSHRHDVKVAIRFRRSGLNIRPIGYQETPGLLCNTAEPPLDARIVTKIEATFVGNMRVCVQQYIGDGVTVPNQIRTVSQMIVHQLEDSPSRFLLFRNLYPPFVRHLKEVQSEPSDCD